MSKTIDTKSPNQNETKQTYTSLATALIGEIHNIGISTKILQFMQKVRNNSDERYALRWVSELLQNTRDCAYKDQGVKILIELSDDKLIYKHNSKPFRVKDILSLINQVTSKVDDDETTGKFGTGFMTTMLLSDTVNIKSIIQDNDLPYKPFEVDINRSPETSEKIKQEIDKSISQLRKADENCAIENFKEDEYNTTFTYELKNDKNKKAAMTGIKNLNETIYYIFAFSNKYKSIKVLINTKNNMEEKEFIKEKETKIADNTYEIKIKEDNKIIKTVIIYTKQKDNISLAMMVDENKNILPIGDNMPKLFISFLLIGSEHFPFPIVINSKDLQPNETRSNIALVDNEDSTDSKINTEIINKSVRYYEEFLVKLIELNYQNFENFIKISKYKEDSEHAEGFVKRNIYQNLYSIIRDKKIIKCNDNLMRELNNENFYIIFDEEKEIRIEMKKIVSRCKDIFYPIEPDNWKENLDGYEIKFNHIKTLEDIVIDVNKKNNNFINIDENELVNWLSDLFQIIKKKPELYKKLMFDEYEFFPCQEIEVFSNIKKCRQIFVDPGIPEYLKNITIESDDNLSWSKRIELKKKLLSKSFKLDEKDIEYITYYDVKQIDEYIQTFLKNKYDTNQTTIEKISKKILCIDENCLDIINLMNLIKGNNLELIDTDSKIKILSKETIDKAVKNCLKIILSLIEKYNKLEDFNSFLKEKEKSFDFLNKFYVILKEYNYEKFNSSRIFPNCKGEFKKLKEIYGNKIEEEELYSIYKKLGKSFDDNIIHKEIKINSDDLSKYYKDKDVAKGIEDYYIKIFVYDNIDINKVNEDIKAISIGLFDWMEKNEEKTKKLMEYFKDKINRARLLDLTVVNTLHEKSKLHDKLSKYFHSEEEMIDFFEKMPIDDFLKFIKKGKENIINNDKVIINIDDIPKNIYSYYNENDFSALLEIIGNAGEKAAFEYFIEEYKKQGFILEEHNDDFSKVKLIKRDNDDFVKIIWFKNYGYDIEIIVNEKGMVTNKYIEVKTHTENSIKSGTIKLSYEQYLMSRKHKTNYSVIVMKAFFFGNDIKCKFNKIFNRFYLYEGDELRPERRDYIFEFLE